ncbi:MAG: aminotransferase class I/II-fold pyridoxal phosphate-dependent enzyme [Bacteroidales bacterium]
MYYGDLVIPTPSWVSYSPQARIVGRHVYWVPTSPDNFWRMSPDQLDKLCRTDPDKPRIVLLNYPQQSHRIHLSPRPAQGAGPGARKYKVILVSDEIYGQLHFRDQHVSVARFYPEGTIISSGLSKWCGAGGWRLGTFSLSVRASTGSTGPWPSWPARPSPPPAPPSSTPPSPPSKEGKTSTRICTIPGAF